jgi:hypothetical protein
MASHPPDPRSNPALRGVDRLLKAIMGVMLLLTLAIVPFFFSSASSQLLLTITYVLPAAVLGLLVLTIILARQGPVRSISALVMGCIFLLGGLAFDIAATVWHSPDLTREANFIARIVLDSGHSLAFTYVYGAIMSILVGLATCFWWMAFLVHYRTWLDTVRSDRYVEFVRLAYGGGILSWRQLLLPLSVADFVATYRACYYWSWINWTVVVIVLTFCHIYAGLEWFEVVPWLHPVVMALIAGALAFLLICGWLYWEFQLRMMRVKGPEMVPEEVRSTDAGKD